MKGVDDWTIVGTVSTIWAIFIAVILSYSSELAQYVKSNGYYSADILLFIIIALSFVIGYLIGRRGRYFISKRNCNGEITIPGIDMKIGDINDIIAREKKAQTVWVVTPDLHYDLVNPQFRALIKENRKNGVQYRYIVPNTELIKKSVESIREQYSISDEIIENEFIFDQSNYFISFINELVIYDAQSDKAFAYVLPPSYIDRQENVVLLDEKTSTSYIEKFIHIWMLCKNKAP